MEKITFLGFLFLLITLSSCSLRPQWSASDFAVTGGVDFYPSLVNGAVMEDAPDFKAVLAGLTQGGEIENHAFGQKVPFLGEDPAYAPGTVTGVPGNVQ